MSGLGSLRVLHLGNTNNIGYLNVKFLREAGICADVIVDRTDHVSYQPLWVEPEGEPLWVRYYSSRVRHGFQVGSVRVPFPYGHRLQQAADVARLARSYDLFQAYNYDAILCLVQRRTPTVAYCVGGDLNVSALSPTWVGTLLRIAYRRAAVVVYSNIDMVSAVDTLGLPHARYMPLPVDTGRFRPPCPDERRSIRNKLVAGADFVCFSPTRQDWEVKGNNRLISAWADLVRRSRAQSEKPLLVLSEWGRDLVRSRGLVQDLDLGEEVRWAPLMNKARLRDWYWAADVVADQFNLKAFGLVALEAMACGRPVVSSADLRTAGSFYCEAPPFLSAHSPAEIAKTLVAAMDDSAGRVAWGKESRDWVETYHRPEVIVREHLAVYRSVLG